MYDKILYNYRLLNADLSIKTFVIAHKIDNEDVRANYRRHTDFLS